MPIGFKQREHCPVCDSTSNRLLCEIPYGDPQLSNYLEQFYGGKVALDSLQSASYRVVLCQPCGFIYQDSILHEEGMRMLYEDWIDHAQSLQKKQTAGANLYLQYSAQIQTLTRLFKQSPDQVKILDYGMGWGYWSRMAQAHGFDVTGFELSQQRSEYARCMGVSVIDELTSELASFDCIYANQVFEHLPDPLQSLKELCLQLKPEGIVCIRVPDGRGVVASLEQGGWSPELTVIHPLEHINCFTRKTLLGLAAQAGLIPFNPPVRLNWGNLWSGIKREFNDRWLTTHLFLRRQ